MEPALAVALLGLAIVAIVLPRPAFASWLGPPLLAVVAIAAGVLGPTAAGEALRPLGAPLAFVVCAVPFAVLLDRAGFFEDLARSAAPKGLSLGAAWVLAGLVVALLNLDAAVVLLTPLYVRAAIRNGRSPVLFGFQPLLLSCLASSALPISNLTNLIAASALPLSTVGFLEHLVAPGLAASAVGYAVYRRLAGRLAALDDPPAPPALAPRPPMQRDGEGGGPATRRRLVALAMLVAAVVAGFLLAPSLGGQPWEAAAGGDLVLALAIRRLPLAAVPWRIVLTVLGLGVLASAAAGPLHVAALLASASPGGVARDVGLGAVGAMALNNLPAVLVALPGLVRHGREAAFGFLLGTNIAPLVLPSASLAGLLWLDTMRRLGAPVGQRAFVRYGWRVALPALAAATLLLVVVQALLGWQ